MNVHVRGVMELAGAPGSESTVTTWPDEPLTLTVQSV